MSIPLPLIFLFTIWMPFYDSLFTLVALSIFIMYSILTIIGVIFRIERMYPFIGYGSFILVSILCLFSGLKAASGTLFLQIILLVIIGAVFVFGFWGEVIVPKLKGKDWFNTFALGVLLIIVFPVLFVAGATMGGHREWEIGLMRYIFGQDLGDKIISYLFGFGFPLLFINLTHLLYRLGRNKNQDMTNA
ncbi:hypothetical protein [Oceanobacillus chungangensis]|uniref:Uncharacterized protein n=1 Tax=Oceanobacillus chungangensis TaxID=1229152 RepID=A0A3D8PHG8_9BACI|nr:hypothetical protein [Oceanobacillus chungangensis]RDW15514.1 hypothetical protein CWR45_17190 [Oceanobacillus chungangensis]